MSMETELKKIAVNLQQLTDAVTTLTAVMEIHKPVVIPTPDDTVKKEPIKMGDAADVIENDISTGLANGVTTGLQIKEADANNAKFDDDNVVDIGKLSEEPMTMQQANTELQAIVAAIGDKGASVRDLLKAHNAITLAQIPTDKYAEFVEEARKLVPGQVA